MVYPYKVGKDHDVSEEKVTSGSLWQGFKENTTVHGIPHVSGAAGGSKKFVWFIISMTAVGWLTYHMYFICSLFFSFRTNVKIIILNENEMDFPAVTLCNLNAIKKSALGMEAAIESLLGDVTPEKKKRRRKRYTDSTPVCLPTDRFQASTGLCYRLFNDTKLTLTNNARDRCENIGGSVYMPTSQEKVDFMKATDLFTIKNVDSYWNWMQNNKWVNEYQLSYAGYTNWNPAMYDSDIDSSHSVVSDSHQWHSKDRATIADAAYTLCQDMVQCIHTPYDPDGDGIGFCWFMPLGDQPLNTWNRANRFCKKYDANARLIQLDSQSKTDYFVQHSGVLNGVTNNEYWLGYQDGLWDTQSGWIQTSSWSNFAPYGTQTYGSDKPAMAYINLNHRWKTGEENSRSDSKAMVICEIDLPVVPLFTTTTTTLGETTVKETTVESTTLQPTTPEISTLESTTLQPTTPEISTLESTTLQLTTPEMSTVESTTLQPTTPEMSTVESTTLQPTASEISTVESTTLQLTTPEISTVESTTLQPTTPEVSTVESTTLQPTTPEISMEQPQTTTTTTTQKPITTTKVSSTVEGRLPLKESFILQETVVENLATIPEETKSKMGYAEDELILDCTYEGSTCSLSEFSKFYSPVLGNCYIFNSGWNASKTIYKARKTGRLYGLSVVLNIGQADYVKKLGGAAGARVVITGQNEMPHPEEDGILLETGKVVSIGLRKVSLERLSHPYGNCTDIYKDEEIDVFSEKYPVKYSAKDCKKTCYQKQLIENCSCADSRFPTSGKAYGGLITHPCDTNNVTEDDCRYVMNSNFISGKLGCDDYCKDNCRESYHTYDLSTAKWPSSAHEEQVIDDYQAKLLTLNLSESGEMEKNLLTVEVFFEDFSLEEITEIPAYNMGQFASDIGGILGLWVGMSVITIFEFCEYGADIIVLMCRNICKKCNRKNKPMSKIITSRGSVVPSTLIVPSPSEITINDKMTFHEVDDSWGADIYDNKPSRASSNDSGVFDEYSRQVPGEGPLISNRRVYYKRRAKQRNLPLGSMEYI